MSFSVYRGGKTARTWTYETGKVNIRTGGDRITATPNVSLRFDLASKGGGTTEVLLEINPDHFHEVIQKMMKVDSATTLKAMGAVIADLGQS